MSQAEQFLYTGDQMRACEEHALSVYQFDEDELMARAGYEAFLQVRSLYPEVNHLAVFCGAGNNAGDGYVLARLAHEQGMTVNLYQCKSLEDLPTTARHAALQALASGVVFQLVDEPLDGDVRVGY